MFTHNKYYLDVSENMTPTSKIKNGHQLPMLQYNVSTTFSFMLTSLVTQLNSCRYICSDIFALTGKSCRTTHVQSRPPITEATSNLGEVSCFGISFTNSKNILVSGPRRNCRQALDICMHFAARYQSLIPIISQGEHKERPRCYKNKKRENAYKEE